MNRWGYIWVHKLQNKLNVTEGVVGSRYKPSTVNSQQTWHGNKTATLPNQVVLSGFYIRDEFERMRLCRNETQLKRGEKKKKKQ